MHHRKLGRQARAYDPRVPHYSALRFAATPPRIPSRIAGWAGLPDDLGIMLNGPGAPGAPVLGDCTVAALHHLRQIGAFRLTGLLIIDRDQDVLADYERLCGYELGVDATDQGGNMQSVLWGAQHDGITTAAGPDCVLGYVEIDPRHPEDIELAIADCGAAYIGIAIPQAWTQADPGSVWDVTRSPIEGGHCVLLTGYDQHAKTFDVVSWGLRFTMTRRAFLATCDEAYAVLMRDWLKPDRTSLGGLTVTQIMTAMSDVA